MIKIGSRLFLILNCLVAFPAFADMNAVQTGDALVSDDTEEQRDAEKKINTYANKLQKNVLKDPEDAVSWYTLASILHQEGLHADAIYAAGEALRFYPDDAELRKILLLSGMDVLNEPKFRGSMSKDELLQLVTAVEIKAMKQPHKPRIAKPTPKSRRSTPKSRRSTPKPRRPAVKPKRPAVKPKPARSGTPFDGFERFPN